MKEPCTSCGAQPFLLCGKPALIHHKGCEALKALVASQQKGAS